MSSLNSLYLKREKILKLAEALGKNPEMKGIEFTVSINDDANDYGQNISAYISQSKEEREAKKPKFYVGNGKTFWTDGNITVAKKKEYPEYGQPPIEDAQIVSQDDPFG